MTSSTPLPAGAAQEMPQAEPPSVSSFEAVAAIRRLTEQVITPPQAQERLPGSLGSNDGLDVLNEDRLFGRGDPQRTTTAPLAKLVCDTAAASPASASGAN